MWNVSTRTLMQIAGWGGLFVSTTGFYLQSKLIDRVRSNPYYKDAMKALRTHRGAVYYLGEPIKDKQFKMSDVENNYYDEQKARFKIPVTGPNDKGTFYFWAEKQNDGWTITRAELDIKSKPDESLVIVKGKSS